jgi:uncharacterized protein (DUF2062 family)
LGDHLRGLKEKMIKDPLPPSRVAAGWALGMFIGCSIPFGLQLLVSVPLAVYFRISKIGATVGTLITNPVTIFFIYPAQTYLVNHFLFGGSLTYERLQKVEWTFESVMQLGSQTLWSFFIGGLLLAFIMTPITYFAVKSLVVGARTLKNRHRDGKGRACTRQ